MISKEEVKRIAKLARLELSENEIEKMQKDMSEILDYFDLLKSASVPPARNFGETKKANELRKDEVAPSFDMKDELIIQAPNKKDGYIKVKNIL